MKEFKRTLLAALGVMALVSTIGLSTMTVLKAVNDADNRALVHEINWKIACQSGGMSLDSCKVLWEGR